ncbi:tetratricopeptide repeat protein [Parapusillimonas sp. SGNA-6]|uniref:tetratricopeptide repeat protein n=1 Tax=Parapedobacter sp. SGR-10 TaxID=2710879 RepID=UPI0013CF847A|nr:tetratricopeptide repeat protein [Parapedobacter sp. SGR-10]NGF55603.1 tetratricopeptide repeat protein [Parapedobacter sp. SGR-10]NGM89450.1 tetratricopeptide repeat protein [Parapusillimonas sp. SGNA-6]
MKTKQILVVVLAVALMGVLLMQPIKGLVDKDKGASTETTEEVSSPYNLQTVSEMSKQSINATIAQEITAIEKQIEQVEGEGKVSLLQQLADKWDDVAKAIPQGFVYEEMARLSPTVGYWVKSGDAYREGYTNLQDTAMVSALNQRAIAAYEQALALDDKNLSAKTGLGSALVTGTNNPMQGIALLREVVEEDPKNVEANKALGLFSLQSQQFDKAIDRFKTVVEQKPDAESYFYLATGYEKIGLKNEAIAAYQKSKEMAADPTLSQYIDRQIEALSQSN